MTERNSSVAELVPRRAKIVVFFLFVTGFLGFLADVTGLLGFITGKDLPSLLHRHDPAPVATSTASQSATAVKRPTKQASAKKTVPTSRPPQRPSIHSVNPQPDDVIKNFHLSLSPPTFAAANPRTIVIETWEGRPHAFVDVEIADPSASGGVCPKLTRGPCNLLYSGGDQADGNGRSRVKFQWFGDESGHDGIHHAGTYTVTVRDRGTGTKLNSDFIAE